MSISLLFMFYLFIYFSLLYLLKKQNQLTFKHQLHASNLNGSVFLSCMRPLVLQLHGICVVSLKNTELAFQKKIIIYSNQQNKSQTTLLTAAACWRLGKGGGDRAERQGEGTLQLAVRQGTRPHHVLPALSEGGLLSVSWSGCLRNHLKRERDREREGGGRERETERQKD